MSKLQFSFFFFFPPFPLFSFISILLLILSLSELLPPPAAELPPVSVF
jgi:hypothetical protein